MANCPIRFDKNSVDIITKESDGYPYFIQFICREVFDVFLQRIQIGETPQVPIEEITLKLDKDFFSGRWARATDRQRELLYLISILPNSQIAFSVQEVIGASTKFKIKKFSNSHANQMLLSLINAGLIYKNRHGKYSFAVPLLSRFIRRQNLEFDQ